MITKMQRREFFKTVPALAGVAGLTGSTLAPLGAQVIGPESTQVAEIYELQAAFHRAKTTQDIELMMSLWDPEAVLTLESVNPPATYVGLDQIQSFFLSSGSWQNQRFSLVPSFKTEIQVHGDYADLFGSAEARPIHVGRKITDPLYFIKEQVKIYEPEEASRLFHRENVVAGDLGSSTHVA